jgi:diacylglycerol kinase family enzyme
MKKHFFVINPKSFHNQKFLNAVISKFSIYFEETNNDDFSIHVSNFPRDAIGAIRSYTKQLNPNDTVRVYAVGGDGILFDCLNGIMGLPYAELATVPYGHTNDFVRAFGEGLQYLFRDIAVQATSRTILTDVLQCGNNYGLNLCTVGME